MNNVHSVSERCFICAITILLESLTVQLRLTEVSVARHFETAAPINVNYCGFIFFSFLMDNFSLDLIRYWRFGFLISHWRCWSLFSQSASIGPRPKVKGRTVFRGPNDSMQVAAFKFQLVRGWIQLQVKGEMVCVIGVNEISIFFFFVSYLIINEELNPNRWKIEDKTTLPVRLI